MNLQKTLSKISAAQKKKALAFAAKIRELEEESKGVFVAFVDDGDDSYDVQIKLNPKSLQFEGSSCDCSSRSVYCPHQVAVMTSILSDNKIDATSLVVKKIRKRKKSKVEQLVETIDPDKVIMWLTVTMEKDPELLLQFNNEFTINKQRITVEELSDQFKTTLKAVIGRRKRIQLAELPKILKLLKPVHDNLVQNYAVELYKPDVFLLFKMIFFHFQQLNQLLAKSTTRLATYTGKLRELINATMSQFDQEKGNQLIGYVFDKENSEELGIQFLTDVLKTFAPKLERDQFVKCLQDYLRIVDDGYYIEERFYLNFLEAGMESPYFEDAMELFPVKFFFNNYNIKLLEAALEADRHDLIERHVAAIVAHNYNYHYSEPYYQILIRSLKQQKKEHEVTELLKKMFFEDPQWTLFLTVYKRLEKEDDQYNFLAKARMIHLNRNSLNYLAKKELKMGILWLLEDYTKAINLIESIHSFRFSIQFVDKLVSSNPTKYFKRMYKAIYQTWDPKDEDYDHFEEIIRSLYTKQKLFIAKQEISGHPVLDAIIEKRLGVE